MLFHVQLWVKSIYHNALKMFNYVPKWGKLES